MIRYILAATIAATPLVAQDSPPCVPIDEARQTLADVHGERMLVTGHVYGGTVEFWLNPLTPSWTVIATGQGKACLVAAGKDWTLDQPKQWEDM